MYYNAGWLMMQYNNVANNGKVDFLNKPPVCFEQGLRGKGIGWPRAGQPSRQFTAVNLGIWLGLLQTSNT